MRMHQAYCCLSRDNRLHRAPAWNYWLLLQKHQRFSREASWRFFFWGKLHGTRYSDLTSLLVSVEVLSVARQYRC